MLKRIIRTIKICQTLLLFAFLFSFFIPKAQVPGAPTNLVVTGINTGGMIQFTAPANDGGSSITNYEYSTDNGSTWIAPSPAITTSPLIISSGLSNCTSYQVKLRAVNASGSGAASVVATLVPSTSTVFGTSWSQRVSATDNNWTSVAYGNGIFVAVSSTGTGNRVMTSPDGINWTSRTSAADNSWSSITYGNGLFVAVANSGIGNRVMTSPDGINWTSRTSAADNNWTSVTYGNGLFVAVSSSGAGNRVMTSPDGINWETQTSAANNTWSSVTYGNGLFVAVSTTGTGNRVMSSGDGINWNIGTSAANNTWSSVTYGNGLFVAVSNFGTGNRVMVSGDGIGWETRTSASNNAWSSVTYGNGLFVAVSADGANRVMTSSDGNSWTSRTPANLSWRSIMYGNGIFVAVATSGTGNRVMTSGFSVAANAPSVTSATLGSNSTVHFSQSTSVYSPAISNYEYSTDNGSNWTALTPAATTSPLTIAGLPGGTNSIMTRALNSVGNSCPSNNYVMSVLPVNLSSFTAKPTPDNKVSLGWNTSYESLNKGFRIERQVGAGNGKYDQIGFVASKAKNGNSQHTLYYSFIDAASMVGLTSFYRLVQEDLDGKLTFSEVRMVKLHGQSVSLVFPNPSNGLLNISRTADGKKMDIQVADQSGKIIIKVKNIIDANYNIKIPQPGVYTIKLSYTETGDQSIQRVVIQK